MRYAIVVLAGLLACTSASGQALEYKKTATKRRPADPAKQWPQRWYVGGSLQQSETRDWSVSRRTDDGSFRSIQADDRDSGYSFYGGVEFKRTSSLALELGHVDFGGTSQTIQSDGSGNPWAAGPIREKQALKGTLFSVLWAHPVGERLSAFLRLGALRWTSEFAYTGTTLTLGRVRHSGTHSHVDAVFGGGLRYEAGEAWQLRAAYMRYPLSDSDRDEFEPTVDALELSVVYRFSERPGG
jgi:hypothetical protein